MNFNRDRIPARNSDRPMYKAVCASCGQDCDVPFRPSGDRPVYYSRCFDEKGRPDSRGSGGMDSRRSNFRDRSDIRILESVIVKDEVVEKLQPIKKIKPKKAASVKK